MKCPRCGELNTSVFDSRSVEGTRRRRRLCLDCDYRFTTTEIAGIVRLKDYHLLMAFDVHTRAGKTERFDEFRLKNSLYHICRRIGKRAEIIDSIAERVRQQALAMAAEPITVPDLVRWVTKELLKIDKMAAMRYSALHIDETETTQFFRALRKVLR